MNEETIKNVLKLKLKIADTLIRTLPEAVKNPAQDFERVLLNAVSGAILEHSTEKPVEKCSKDLKSISIE